MSAWVVAEQLQVDAGVVLAHAHTTKHKKTTSARVILAGASRESENDKENTGAQEGCAFLPAGHPFLFLPSSGERTREKERRELKKKRGERKRALCSGGDSLHYQRHTRARAVDSLSQSVRAHTTIYPTTENGLSVRKVIQLVRMEMLSPILLLDTLPPNWKAGLVPELGAMGKSSRNLPVAGR